MRILLVEDEAKIANFISRGLKEEHYAVDVAHNAENALFQAEINPYDLIILDIMLPDGDGISVCRELRRKKMSVPILMLTAKGSPKDKVLGLDSGADDYLVKPFAFEELLARIRAATRRNKADKAQKLNIADLELDLVTHKVTRGGKEITLTSKEYSLLQFLLEHRDEVVTRTMISEHVWDENFDSFTNVIDVYINYLRAKIDTGFKNKLIHTMRGVGYILREEGK